MKRLSKLISKPITWLEKAVPGRKHNSTAITFEEWIAKGGYLTPRINIGDVAEQTGLTNHELRHLCMTCYGCTFSKKIKMLRIEQACRILAEQKDIPISSIGSMIGIDDRSNFRKEFKSITGVYPQEWRNMHA